MSINKTIIPARIRDTVISRLAGKVASTSKPIYSYQDPYFNGLGQFTRNPDCWINGVTNISCFSPAQLSGANWRTRAGTLLTTKHVLFAKHFVPAIITGGTPLIFVDENNNVVRRKLMQLAYHPYTDVAIGVLESDVPTNIKIAKVLPKNYADYMDFYSVTPIYVVGIDQQEKALVTVFSVLQGNIMASWGNVLIRMFQVALGEGVPLQYRDFSEALIAGDSGNPAFLIINNELVVTTTWWTGGTFGGGGPFISDPPIYDMAQQLIESLSPGEGYTMTDVDLSALLSTRQLYFQETVDANWSTAGNWFQDASFTIPAAAPPTAFDTPVLPWAKTGQRVIGGSGVLSGF